MHEVLINTNNSHLSHVHLCVCLSFYIVKTELRSLLIYSIQILTTSLFRFEILNNGYLSFSKDFLYDSMTFQSCYIFLTTINVGNNTICFTSFVITSFVWLHIFKKGIYFTHKTEIITWCCDNDHEEVLKIHKINTKLFSISFPQLHCLHELALESTNFDYSSAEYRVIAIILDNANFRLFRHVRSDVPAEKPKHFMKIKFLNKAVDAINLPALLRSTSVTNKIPVYFRDKEPPIVSYEYTSTVASKLFNFAPALSNLNVSVYFSNP